MSVEVQIPSVGESITDGVLAKWHVKNGEWVEKGQPLLDFETDKITQEVPAPESGSVELLASEGATVSVGSLAARIDPSAKRPAGAGAAEPAADTQKDSAANKSAASEKMEAPKSTEHIIAPEKPVLTEPKKTARVTQAEPRPGKPEIEQELAKPVRPREPAAAKPHDMPENLRLAPSARRVLTEQALDPNSITPSGRGGVITKPDVLKAIQDKTAKSLASPGADLIDEGTKAIQSLIRQPRVDQPSKAVATVPAGAQPEERVPMSRLRQTIAKRLVAAKNETAMLTTFNEVDMSAVLTIRKRYQDAFANKYGVKLGFMAFFVKACADALKMYPSVNARIDETDIVYQKFYNIGIAVGTDKGLVVPVLRGAAQKSFADIEAAIRDFAERARSNKIVLEDLQGGTFTITNGGIYGSMLSTPILNLPQTGILGMHNIVKRPIVIENNGKDEIMIRPMMYLALSYDHRVIDGKEAVGFLIRVKDCIENPERMLLEL